MELNSKNMVRHSRLILRNLWWFMTIMEFLKRVKFTLNGEYLIRSRTFLLFPQNELRPYVRNKQKEGR